MGDVMGTKTLVSWASSVLGLGAVLLTLAPAEAATRRDRTAQHQTPERHSERKPVVQNVAMRQSRAAPSAPLRGATPASASVRGMGRAQAAMATPVRGRLAVSRDRQSALSSNQDCRPASGRRSRCVGGQALAWTRGLEPAAGIQASECPDGTMATQARGHEDIIRCMLI